MQISEYLDPILRKKTILPKIGTSNSKFLDSFLQSNYTIPTAK